MSTVIRADAAPTAIRTREYTSAEAEEQLALHRAAGDQYQVVRLLGRGGMGAVYLVRDRALHRVVAIKLLLAGQAGAEACERFRREARIAAQLAHPDILPLYSFGETSELLYMVMPYIDGDSLTDRLRTAGKLSPDEVRLLLASLALTLEYAHAQGVVHRDLKPENILFRGDNSRPMIADFGVALRRGWDTGQGGPRRVAGSPHFMSPEQLFGDPDIDGRSDLYALGVIGYQLLTGVTPFDGPNPMAVAAQHVMSPPPPLASRAKGAPPDLVSIIEKCLAKHPEQRWKNARALHAALTSRRPVGRVRRMLGLVSSS